MFKYLTFIYFAYAWHLLDCHCDPFSTPLTLCSFLAFLLKILVTDALEYYWLSYVYAYVD